MSRELLRQITKFPSYFRHIAGLRLFVHVHTKKSNRFQPPDQSVANCTLGKFLTFYSKYHILWITAKLLTPQNENRSFIGRSKSITFSIFDELFDDHFESITVTSDVLSHFVPVTITGPIESISSRDGLPQKKADFLYCPEPNIDLARPTFRRSYVVYDLLERGVLDPAHRAPIVFLEPNAETEMAKPDVPTWHDERVRSVFEANCAQIAGAYVVACGQSVDGESAHGTLLSRFHPLSCAIPTIDSVTTFDKKRVSAFRPALDALGSKGILEFRDQQNAV
jgi:hypothetical protein